MGRIAATAGVVSSFATEAALLADASSDGVIAYAQDVDDHYTRAATSWRVVRANEIGGRTLNAIVSAIGSASRAVVISAPVSVASNLTVPTNVELRFERGGRLDLANGVTLTVRGEIVAGLQQIFSYGNSACAVVFGSGADQRGRPDVRPEWWGALGDDTTDDSAAHQRMLDVGAELEHGLCFRYQAGRAYKITTTQTFAPAGFATCEAVFHGYGSRLRWYGTSAIPVLKIGDQAAGRKAFDSRILGLSIQRSSSVSKVAGSACLEVNRADFLVVEDCHFSGMGYGVHADGEGGNSFAFLNNRITGCTTGFHNMDADNFNVWTIRGGKIQQGEIGVHAKGVGFELTGVDFSLLTQSAAKLENASEGIVRCYTEGIGPLTGLNTAKVYHLVACTAVEIANSRVNAGGLTYTDNCGYGVYVEGASSQITLRRLRFIQPQIADIVFTADVDGESCVVDQCNHTENGNDMTAAAQKLLRISDATDTGVRNRCASRLLPRLAYPGETPPNALASVDLSDANWNLLGGASITGTVTAPFGGGETAQVVAFPNTPYAGDTGQVSRLEYDVNAANLGEELTGKIVALRFWYKAIDVLSTSVYDLHRAQSYLQRTVADLDVQAATGVFDGTDGWTFAEHRYEVPSGTGQVMRVVGFKASQYGGDGVSIAIWKPQLVLLDDHRDEVPYIDQRRPALSGVA